MSDAAKDVLSAAQIEQFIQDGYLRIDNAFSTATAAAAREILWRDTGCDPNAPSTWTQPVVRLGGYSQSPFIESANNPRLHGALDQLVGPGRWLPCMSVGSFPVRFPSSDDPGDAGWHIDMAFDFEQPDFLSWRANIRSKGRALLMLFLYSDIEENDAPTRIRAGSHRDIARLLAPAGESGLTLRELAANGFDESAHRAEVLATGAAGTVYLCHPFLVHAAQKHRGRSPRFLAQPPLLPKQPFCFYQDASFPVAEAIRRAVPDAAPAI